MTPTPSTQRQLTGIVPRIKPTVPVAIGVMIAYSVVFTLVTVTSGIPYNVWFATAGSAFRTGVLALFLCAVLLVVFLIWARWDFVFRDPERLPMPRFYWVPIVMFAVGVVVHLMSISWSRLTPGLLIAILAAGVLVGFCEEVLFRGILLRTLRNGTRAEAWCLLWSSVIFGVFHLANVISGAPLVNTLGQVGLAATSGAILYLFRRGTGLLVTGMVAHGAWDMSLFLPGGGGGAFGALGGLALLVIMPALGVAVLVVSLVRDRRIVVSSAGVAKAEG